MKTTTITTRLLVVILALLVITTNARTEWVYVQRVIDGDTFVAQVSTRIRVQGIDTPETKHPTQREEPGGSEATELAKAFLEHNYVWVEGTATDKYGRRGGKVTVRGGQSYADIVKAHGFDKDRKQIFSYSLTMTPLGEVNRTRSAYVSTSPYRFSAGDFTWVNGYFRADGTLVSGHYRQKASQSSSPLVASPVPSTVSPPVSSGDGTVHVGGYTRKDGTYVRPHTRSAPRK